MKRNEWYWLPYLFTMLNCLMGFWAIVQILEGNILTACWLIIIASLFDGFDGKLARYVSGASEIGVELDSFADVVSFGVAPAVLLYQASFFNYGLLGVLLAAFPIIFGAFRLARFNCLANGHEGGTFVGLPIPMQAMAISTFILFNQAIWEDIHLEILLVPFVFFLSFLMISHIPYEKLPRISFRDTRKNLLKLLVILAGIALVAIKPPIILFPLVILYIFHGMAVSLFGLEPEEELESACTTLDDDSVL
ncbi:MAG: CDP-diacylglycerol--serine O-phosphatidyltransferase [bacterium]